MRVLIAEDERINRLYLRHVLTRSGHEVALASDGEEAVRLAAEGRFDLILMDLNMPVFDGAEAVRRIRAAESDAGLPAVPIAALSAYLESDERDTLRDAGVSHYLSKPIDGSALLGFIGRLNGLEES